MAGDRSSPLVEISLSETCMESRLHLPFTQTESAFLSAKQGCLRHSKAVRRSEGSKAVIRVRRLRRDEENLVQRGEEKETCAC